MGKLTFKVGDTFKYSDMTCTISEATKNRFGTMYKVTLDCCGIDYTRKTFCRMAESLFTSLVSIEFSNGKYSLLFFSADEALRPEGKFDGYSIGARTITNDRTTSNVPVQTIGKLLYIATAGASKPSLGSAFDRVLDPKAGELSRFQLNLEDSIEKYTEQILKGEFDINPRPKSISSEDLLELSKTFDA